jgi:ribosomal protein S18 acetylase RimI-like enzyme
VSVNELTASDPPWEIRPYRLEDESEVIALWERCELTRPWNDPKQDIARKMQVNPELFLVAMIETRVIGTVMAGYEGHRGSINYLAVDGRYRRKGLGRELVCRAERLMVTLGCPKINLQIRLENKEVVQFYAAMGYHTFQVIDMAKRLEEGVR